MSIAKRLIKDILYGNKITFVLRVVLGLIFILSSISKIINPQDFADVIRRYNVLGEVFVPYVAVILPFLELLIGLLLVIGFKVKASAFIASSLMVVFIVLIGVNMVRGESFSCGCLDLGFLGIILDERIGIELLIRDSIYLFFAVLVFKADRHLFSLQSLKDRFGLISI